MVGQERGNINFSGDLVGYGFIESQPVPEYMLIQARFIQGHIINRYGNFIDPEVIERNKDLPNRIVLLNDKGKVDALQEWRLAEVKIDESETQIQYLENISDPRIRDINTGYIHIFDRSGEVSSDQARVNEDPTIYTQDQADYLNTLDLAYNIYLQYLDPKLSVSFRIAASAYYAEEVIQEMRIQTPFGEWFMGFHKIPAQSYVKAGCKYGANVHKMAFGTLRNEYMLRRNIKRIIEA